MVRELIQGEPVLVDCPRGQHLIRIRPAFSVEKGLYAVIESVEWERAGELITSYTQQDGQVRKVWKAVSEGGAVVTAATRRAAIAALLAARGEFEVTIEQTIPSLFDFDPEPAVTGREDER